MWEPRLKIFIFATTLACLSGCSWFHPRPQVPAPPELIVTGVPAGSIVFIDNVQNGQAAELSDKPQVLTVAAGEHIVEVRTGSGGTKTAEYWIVPSGATFDSTGTQTVDESKVKAVPDHPKPAAKKRAAKKAAKRAAKKAVKKAVAKK